MRPELAPVAFLSALSVLIVLPWHWRAGNVATLAIAFWLFLANIIFGVDASIWGNNVDIVVPVWCDITTKLIIGINFGLPAACLCICIHLEQVASLRRAKTTGSDKHRRQIFESLMCFGLPILFMGLHFVVQGHRFDIIEEYGCRPTTYFSIPALFIVWLPPLIVSIIALGFSGMALRHFMLRRITFAVHLNSTQSALTTSRYLRLMLMAALQMVWSITITAYTLWFTVMAVPIRPWTTWDDVHSDFTRIDQYPVLFTPQIILTAYYVMWWMVPISTVIFVAFFAFGRDAMDEYKKCFLWFRTHILRQSINPTNNKGFTNMPQSKFKQLFPMLSKSSASTGSTIFITSSLPQHENPNPPSSSKYCSSINDTHYGSRPQSSHYESSVPSPYLDSPKALGSLSDLTPMPTWPRQIAVIPMTPYSPPEPLTPSSRPRAYADHRSPASPRPFTYPSHQGTTLP